MKYRLALFFTIFSSCVWAVKPEIHSVTYQSGVTFRHFELNLIREAILLAKDFPDRVPPLDEKSVNFKYGQFEIFIPVSYLNLPLECKSHYIARMPQTLGLSKKEAIKEKQELYASIVEVYNGDRKSVKSVFEITHYNCNIFFRDFKGRYIDYIGPVKSLP